MNGDDAVAGLDDGSYGDVYDPYAATPYYGQTVGADAANFSDTDTADGFGASASGTPRDLGGVGEFLTNAWKNLSNGFLGALSPNASTNRQGGGALGAPGPGTLGRFALPAGSVINQSGFIWLLALGAILFVLFGMMRR